MAVVGANMNLFEWQRARLPELREIHFAPMSFDDMTIVVYHFWEEPLFDPQFDAVEAAVYETWRHCGLIKTHLVVNRMSVRLETFAFQHSGVVDIRVNPALVPGCVPSMSVDFNANLWRYFDTESVLVIQNDGFPLRPGLEEFRGCYDYVGAPFIRKTVINRMLGLWPRFAVGNGGFSLRSKRICEMASFYWQKRYHRMPADWWGVREDCFYCVLLPLLERDYRRIVRFAPFETARRFAYDSLYNEMPESLPFGFHGQSAFRELIENDVFNPFKRGEGK